MATYSDSAQRDLDQRSGEAMDRRATARELAAHYTWSGPVPQWLIDAEDDPQRLADEDYCANHCAEERREWEDCALVGGCPLLRNK